MAENQVMTKPLLNLILASLFIITGPFAFAAKSTSKTYKREVLQEKGQNVYVVNARAPHLFMISRDLYGDDKSWKQIAAWNNLKPPYELSAGQRLVLKKPPTKSAEEGDEILIAAWTKQKRTDIANGIKASQEPHAAPAAAVEEKPVAAEVPGLPPPPAPTPLAAAEPAPEVSPTPPAVLLAPPSTAKPVHTLAEAERVPVEPKTEHKHESNWEFRIAAIGSKFKLDTTNKTTATHIKLDSEVDYGLELEIGYRMNESALLFFSAGAEKMDIHKLDTFEIEGESQYISRFALGLDAEATERFSILGSFVFEQIPFSRMNGANIEVKAVSVPQVSLGFVWTFFKQGGFGMGLSANGLYLLPKKQDDYDLKAGQGWDAALRFQNKFQSTALVYAIGYRGLSQDSEEATNKLDGYFANIGLNW
jgi:hypothetical protein